MASITKDIILSQIPSHIIDNHPRFCDFLEAYYEWLNQEGNPYRQIKSHMNYMDFTESMDQYVDLMKDEYLSDVPDRVLVDKELFIKWSKKFHLTRGSHASYKFLFRLLFNEQDVEIYTPKDNVLKTSDGNWISGESKIILTNSVPIQDFSFQSLVQEQEIATGVYQYASATIQSYRMRYAGKMSVIELSVTDIEGDFDPDFPIMTESGESWILPTINRVTIQNGGTNYQVGDRIAIDNLAPYVVTRQATQEGVFDARITSMTVDDQIAVKVNGVVVSDAGFDGRYATSPSITIGSTVEVTVPAYGGYLSVSDVDPEGRVVDVAVDVAPVGTTSNLSVVGDAYGTGFVGVAHAGLTNEVEGYYTDNRGQLSSDMYLQDSFYYQDYSYAIKTTQDISKYGEIVKELLHPSGFAMFGSLNAIDLVELILSLEGSFTGVLPLDIDSRARYTLGPNYSFLDRFKHGLSKRLYRMYHFRADPERFAFDMEYAAATKAIFYMDASYVQDLDSTVENYVYNLEDASWAKTFDVEYYGKGFITKEYMNHVGPYYVNKIGWMTKHNFVDHHLYVPQEYTAEVESGNQYAETGYFSERVEGV